MSDHRVTARAMLRRDLDFRFHGRELSPEEWEDMARAAFESIAQQMETPSEGMLGDGDRAAWDSRGRPVAEVVWRAMLAALRQEAK